jgi:hypothetical protein
MHGRYNQGRLIAFKEKTFITPSAREYFREHRRDIDYSILGAMTPQDFDRLMQMDEFAAIAGKQNMSRVFRLACGREVDYEKAGKSVSSHLELRALRLLEQIFKNVGPSAEALLANLRTDGKDAAHAITSLSLQILVADHFPLIAAVRSEIKYPALATPANRHLRGRVQQGIISDAAKWTVARTPDGNHSFDDLANIISTYLPEMDLQIERHVLGWTAPDPDTAPGQILH